MAKLTLAQLEQSTTIPAGSLHLVEMGDGSGTKTVTQETLVKETGEALKIGNLAELQTEEKTSIVEAINEVKQSGGSGGEVVDILDSKEEIEANTEPGKVAGAAAVKEMFSELNDKLMFPDGTCFYPDMKDGVIGFNTNPERGADTFHPFNKSTALYLGDVSWTHYGGMTNTYDFRQTIIDAGLNPNDYSADNIFFRPKSTTYKSSSSSNNTLERGYTYLGGIITTTSGYTGALNPLTVTSSCYLVG